MRSAARHALVCSPTLSGLLALAIITAAARCTTPPQDTTPATLRIDGARRFQTLDGFGVNANVNGWSAALRPALDRLVDENGASLWRVYIDNTDWETTNDNADPFVFDWSYYNALYTSARFEQAWSLIAYLNQKGMKGKQIVLNFMGPGPAWIGGARLDPARVDEWIEMILSYVYYARFTRNLSFALLAPFNEPDWNCKEGVCADQSLLTTVLQRMAARLDALGLSDVRFVQPDTASIGAAANQYIPEMLTSPAVMAKIDDFGVHNYRGDSSTVPAVIAGSDYANRGFWVTEQSFGNALDLAAVDNLMNHIEDGATATLVFKAYDQQDNHHPPGEDLTLGLFALSGGVYTPRKAFYTTAMVHRFIRPGAVRIAADENLAARIFAFHHPSTGQVTILGRNPGGSTVITSSLLNLPAFSQFEMYYTDQSSDFVRLSNVPVSNGAFTFTAPANSVFTLTRTRTK